MQVLEGARGGEAHPIAPVAPQESVVVREVDDKEFDPVIEDSRATVKTADSSSVANRKKEKQENQDSYGITLCKIEDPGQFFRGHIAKLVEDHKSYEKIGSTFCGAIYDPRTKKITVGNLGDSRVYLLFQKDSERPIFVLLSEDFAANIQTTGISDEVFEANANRFTKAIKKAGGDVFKNRAGNNCVNGILMVAGGVGDNDPENKGFITEPDIISHDIDKLKEALSLSDYKASKVLVVSDGMSSSIDTHMVRDYHIEAYSMKCDEGGVQPRFAKIERSTTLGDFVEFLPEGSREEYLQSMKIPLNGLSATDLTTTALKHGVRDDITVVAFDLNPLEPHKHPVLAFVADGHGTNAEKISGRIRNYMLRQAHKSLDLQAVVQERSLVKDSKKMSLTSRNTHRTNPHENQDRFVVAYCDTKNPSEFFKDNIKTLVETFKTSHACAKKGATFCGAIYDPATKEVTVANLGNSRVYAVFKHKESNNTMLVCLSEDFVANNSVERDQKLPEESLQQLNRFTRSIQEQNGEIIYDRVKKKLFLADSNSEFLGAVGYSANNAIIVKPDIFIYNLEDLKKQLNLEDYEVPRIIAASSGLASAIDSQASILDAMEDAAICDVRIMKYDEKSSTHKFESLLKQGQFCPLKFDPFVKEVEKREDLTQEEGEADLFTVRLKRNARMSSKEDLTIATIDLTKSHNHNHPVLAMVADGHGENGESVAQGIADHMIFQAEKSHALASEVASVGGLAVVSCEQVQKEPEITVAQGHKDPVAEGVSVSRGSRDEGSFVGREEERRKEESRKKFSAEV